MAKSASSCMAKRQACIIVYEEQHTHTLVSRCILLTRAHWIGQNHLFVKPAALAVTLFAHHHQLILFIFRFCFFVRRCPIQTSFKLVWTPVPSRILFTFACVWYTNCVYTTNNITYDRTFSFTARDRFELATNVERSFWMSVVLC